VTAAVSRAVPKVPTAGPRRRKGPHTARGPRRGWHRRHRQM